MARDYTGGGYTDWYLPSKDELNKLYINRVAIGGFAPRFGQILSSGMVYDYGYSYWSSTEDDDGFAWSQIFKMVPFATDYGLSEDNNGEQYSGHKDDWRHVRAIRSFQYRINGTLSSTVTGSSLTSVGTLGAGAVPYSLLTGTAPTFNQNTTGNAATATLAITATTATTAATATTAGNITATTNTTLTSLSSLATVGTITSGVWSGTAVAVAKGGTGLTAVGTNGQVLTSTNAGTLTWKTTAVFLPTVVIGTQQWMKENLDVMTYRNGDVIPQVTDPTAWVETYYNETGAWCWYNNDPLNGAIYGKLYNWYAVNDPRGLAPQGWHIPTDAEWTTLGTLLGGDAVAGGKMKTTGTTRWAGSTSATNESGFSALPGGSRYLSVFHQVGSVGYWWSATEVSSFDAWFRGLSYWDGSLYRGSPNKKDGFSVRCLRD